jgi:predicted phosphodiesterase
MKILYYTDLHGDKRKYNQISRLIEFLDVQVIIDSGDMLPKGSEDIFQSQKEFIETFLKPYLHKF